MSRPPASISVVYAVMMKDYAGAVANMLPILVILVAGLFVGFVWQLIRSAFASSLDKARSRSAEDTQATLQMTTGSYLPEGATVTDQPDTNVSLKKDSTLAKKTDSDTSDK